MDDKLFLRTWNSHMEQANKRGLRRYVFRFDSKMYFSELIRDGMWSTPLEIEELGL